VKARLIVIGAGGLAFLALLLYLSIFVFKAPKAIVDIKSEKLVTIAESSNEALTVAITNTLFTAWVVMALLLLICFLAVRKRALLPSGLYNAFEAIIELILNFVTGIAGERNGRRFFPLIATFLLYITLANWLSLTPLFNTIGIFEPLGAEEREFHEHAVVAKEGAVTLILPKPTNIEIDAKACEGLADEHEAEACREAAIEAATAGKVKSGERVGILAPYLRGINTDLMTPLSFALVSVFFVEWWGISSLGFLRYARKFANWGGFIKGIFSLNIGRTLNGFIDGFVSFLEFIAEVARLISFSFRLFGNMLAGEILLLVMTSLIVLAAPLLVGFYFLELFVGFIQAFVFGALTLVFAVLAVSAHGPEEHAEEGHH